MSQQQNKEQTTIDHQAAVGKSVVDGQRWKNTEQRNEGVAKNLSREQIEAGTATSGHATTHAGYPEEVDKALNTETQPVRIGEKQFQQKHHINKDDQIGGENQKSISEEIREKHGLEDKGDCKGCDKDDCKGCGDQQK